MWRLREENEMNAGIYVATIAILSGLLSARNLAALEIAVAGEQDRKSVV